MKGVIIGASRDEEKEDEKITAKALRPEIRGKVFSLLMSHPILKPILITFTFSGLRPQELLALDKRKHLDLENGILSIKTAVKRIVKFDEYGNVVSREEILGKTKTEKSVRDSLMPDIVVEAIKEWFVYCENNNIKSDFLFPNTRNGERRTYSGLRSLLNRFLEKHGLENEGISLKTFRHTFATVLLENREHPKIVAELMGHVVESTTMIYSHIISKRIYTETANTLDKVYAGFNVDKTSKKTA